jgi:hypothetical protein
LSSDAARGPFVCLRRRGGWLHQHFVKRQQVLDALAVGAEGAQGVLDVRALPRNATSSLADLDDPDTMPAELRKAHRDLDLTVAS